MKQLIFTTTALLLCAIPLNSAKAHDSYNHRGQHEKVEKRVYGHNYDRNYSKREYRKHQKRQRLIRQAKRNARLHQSRHYNKRHHKAHRKARYAYKHDSYRYHNSCNHSDAYHLGKILARMIHD